MDGMKNTLYKLLLFTSVLLITGVGFGAMLVLVLDIDQRNQLLDELSVFYGQVAAGPADIGWLSVLTDELKTLLLAWVLGLSCIGFPVILAFVFAKGLAVGFTVGFFVHQWSWQGVLLAAASVLPHNLFFVPALIVAASAGIRFSLILLGLLLRKRSDQVRRQWLRYNGTMAAVGVLFIVGSLVETFVTVPLMDWIINIVT